MDEKGWRIGAGDGAVDDCGETDGKPFGGTKEIQKCVDEGEAGARLLNQMRKSWGKNTVISRTRKTLFGDSAGLHLPAGSDTYTRSQLGQERVILWCSLHLSFHGQNQWIALGMKAHGRIWNTQIEGNRDSIRKTAGEERGTCRNLGQGGEVSLDSTIRASREPVMHR